MWHQYAVEVRAVAEQNQEAVCNLVDPTNGDLEQLRGLRKCTQQVDKCQRVNLLQQFHEFQHSSNFGTVTHS